LTGNWKLDYKVKGKNVSANEDFVMANYAKKTLLMSKIGGDNA
jgi:hypothetical protein